MPYILHIPHSSIVVPNRYGFDEFLIQAEINLLTDWHTDKIFNVRGIPKVIAQFSRVFCDVERLPDKDEPMFKKGMGICYTHTDNLKTLRHLTPDYKKNIITQFYLPHHQKLTRLVETSLLNYESVTVVDCHSFSSVPLKREINQSLDRPDICLGVDKFHTPKPILNQFRRFFKSQGFSVAINKPYSGTVIPLDYYQKESRAKGIMIEINKKLYMDEKRILFYPQKIHYFRTLMEKLLSY
ncbi:MAG: N-formylglutamate amidohydrolase [Microgenomates group bacterium]